jgi:hypothetical protein
VSVERRKRSKRREGRVKLRSVPRREIIAMARAKVVEDAAYRARLIAEAKRVVEEWTAEGFFGQRAAQRQLERNSKHLSNSQHPGSQGLSLNECHAQNGAVK